MGRQFDEGWPDDESRAVIEAIRSVVTDPSSRSTSERLLNEAGRRWAEAHRSGTLMRGRLEALGALLEAKPEPARSDYLAALRLVTDAATWTSLDHLEREALVDPLTGAGNRRALDLALEGASSAALQLGIGLVVVAIDVDGLKRINDESGHRSGDRALVALVDALAGTIRASDAVFRTGGDEFVLVLQGTGLDTTGPLMDRIAGAGAPPFSWGAAALTHHRSRPADLVAAADDDLYRRRKAARHPGAIALSTEDRRSEPATPTDLTAATTAGADVPAGGRPAAVRMDARRARPRWPESRRRTMVAAAAAMVLIGGVAGTVVGLSPQPPTRTASAPTTVNGPAGHGAIAGRTGAGSLPTPSTVVTPSAIEPTASGGFAPAGGGRLAGVAPVPTTASPSRASADTVAPTVSQATAAGGGAVNGAPPATGSPTPGVPPATAPTVPSTTPPATSPLGAVVSGLVGTVDGVAGTAGQVLSGLLGILAESAPVP